MDNVVILSLLALEGSQWATSGSVLCRTYCLFLYFLPLLQLHSNLPFPPTILPPMSSAQSNDDTPSKAPPTLNLKDQSLDSSEVDNTPCLDTWTNEGDSKLLTLLPNTTILLEMTVDGTKVCSFNTGATGELLDCYEGNKLTFENGTLFYICPRGRNMPSEPIKRFPCFIDMDSEAVPTPRYALTLPVQPTRKNTSLQQSVPTTESSRLSGSSPTAGRRSSPDQKSRNNTSLLGVHNEYFSQRERDEMLDKKNGRYPLR